MTITHAASRRLHAPQGQCGLEFHGAACLVFAITYVALQGVSAGCMCDRYKLLEES